MKRYIDLIYSSDKYKNLQNQIEKTVLSYFFLTDEKALTEIRKASGKNYAFFEFAVQNSLLEWIDEYAQYDWTQSEISALFELTIESDVFESFVKLSQYFVLHENDLLISFFKQLQSDEENNTVDYMLESYNEFFLNYIFNINTEDLNFNGTLLDLCRIYKKKEYVSKLQQYSPNSENHPLLIRPYKKINVSQPGILLWSAD